MFGVMGLSAAFANAAGRGGRKFNGNVTVLKYSAADPSIYQLSCAGKISVISVKNSEKIKQVYENLHETELSISADANTNIIIQGDVTFIKFKAPYVYDYPSLITVDLSENMAIDDLYIGNATSLQTLDFSKNIELTKLVCEGCSALQNIDLSKNNKLTYFADGGNAAISQISYPATNGDVSTEIASMITNANAADGTVYTDSEGAYYSTIADAATAKGWTIEQLS